MNNLEFFQPSEGGEAYDPAAFERFKQQMQRNAAFIAAAKQSEQKQKKKEDRLAAILLKFIQGNQKSAILMLAAKLLEENIPASVILSIIILGNEEVQRELKAEIAREVEGEQAELQSGAHIDTALMPKITDHQIPPYLRVEIDAWAKGIFDAASAVPFQLLATALDNQGNVKQIMIDCAANILEDFLENAGGKNLPYDTYFSFCEFLMKGVMQKVREQIENQKELR